MACFLVFTALGWCMIYAKDKCWRGQHRPDWRPAPELSR